MPRPLRIHYPDVPLHVVQRGHNRAACFFSGMDYACYLHWLHESLSSRGIALHAYALMTNHVHLLLTPPSAEAVGRAMISLHRRYVHYVNKKYGRFGTLWEGRYRSSLIQSERYLFACQRYIELNPVRAGIVSDPARYRWSSYPFYAFGRSNTLLTSSAAYLALGESAADRQSVYREACGATLDDGTIDRMRTAFSRGLPLGDAQFVEWIERMTGVSCRRIPPGRPPKKGMRKTEPGSVL